MRAGQDATIQAGQTTTFDIRVTNSGDTTLTTVPLTDTYDSARLAYVSAVPCENTSSAGTAHWDNLGTLRPGQSTTVTATFRALSSCPGQVTTDTVTVSGATDINTDPAPVANASADIAISAPSLTLTKERVADQDPYIQLGQHVTFALTVRNTGNTTLETVPLGDTWDPDHLAFVSATEPYSLAADSVGWTLGPIAPGTSATVQLRLIAVGDTPQHSTTDTATVIGALDENHDRVNDAISTATINITKPAITVTKRLQTDQDAFVQVRETVTYEIVVGNSGDIELETVPLSDVFDPAVFEFT